MFNEYSLMPERAMGGVDVGLLPTQANMDDVQPSIQGTDRFGLQAQGKGYLLRKYNIAISKKGAPYFEPVQSLLKAFILDAPAVLAEARARVKGDEKLQARIEALIDSCTEYFNAQIEDAGADREWLAKSLVIWPLTDQVGFHMYKAASGEADLVDYATYLFRTDANVKDMNDLEAHDGYQKRQFWTDLAYDELGVVDGLIAAVDPDSTDYNVEAVLRSGYQSAAGMDTRNHLRGVTGHAPVTSDSASADIRSQVLASRRVASQAA